MRPFVLALALLGPALLPGLAASQAVSRTDTPRAGTLRVSFDPVITTYELEFTDGHKHFIGSSLESLAPPVLVCFPVGIVQSCQLTKLNLAVRAERRETPLALEYGITNRLAIGVKVPVVRTRIQERHDSTPSGAVFDSLLADTTYGFSPIVNTPRYLLYWLGDVEVQAKYRVLAGANSATSVAFVLRLPTGHQDSPSDLFDLSTGDHQTDLEIQAAQELTLMRRLWLNLSVRAARQQPGTRERRVGPPSDLFLPHAAQTTLGWDPGDYIALDVAPMYRFSPYFGVGFTAGYYTQQRDRYSYRSPQDSIGIAGQLGGPVPASILDAGTATRITRLGVAVSYVGPRVEGGLSIEQVVSAAGVRVPAASVFRIVMRTSRWPF